MAGRGFVTVPPEGWFDNGGGNGKKGGPIAAMATSRFYETGESLEIAADGLPEEEGEK